MKLKNTYKITHECPLKIWKRFLDDCFGIWADSIEKLYQFLDDINKIHPTIKFTLEHSSPFYCGLKDEHDCWCHRTKSIPFLDTKLYIEDRKITTDLYRKPTDRCICIYFHHLATHLTTYLIHLHTELYEFSANQNLGMYNSLLSRDYNSSIVDSAIVRAKAIPREVALKKVEKKDKTRSSYNLYIF